MTIGRRMAKGAAWMISLRFFIRAVGLVSTIILARLLTPQDFGLVAMATVLMGLIVLLSEMNVEAVLVQRKEIDNDYLDGAFGLKVLMATVQALVLAVMAVPAAAFYSEPRLEAIVYVLALAVFVDGLRNIGVVSFQRELQFHREFIMMAVPKVVAFFVTIIFAVLTRSYWALVAGILVTFLGRTVLSYMLHSYRPKLARTHWPEIFRFSKWLLMGQGLRYLTERGPDLVLGRLIGARAVGLFSVAYEIAMLPTTEMVAPINRAVFPGYSQMDVGNGELRRSFLQVAGLIALVAVPAGIGISVSAPVLVPLLLGDRWLNAIPLVHILGLAGGVLVLMANTGAVFLALGRPHIDTALMALRAVLLLAGIVYGAQIAGTIGVAGGYLIVLVMILPVQLATTLWLLSARLSEYLVAVYRPILACVAMYSTVDLFLLPRLDNANLNLLIDAVSIVAFGSIVYVVTVFILWTLAGRPAGAESQVIDVASKTIVKLHSRTSRQKKHEE